MKKKNSFKTAALLVILAISAVPVFAQPGQGQGGGQGRGQGGGQGGGQSQGRGGRQMSEEDIKKNVDVLADTLQLTEKQTKQILDVDMEFYNTFQKERANFDPETGDRDAMRARMTELRIEREGKYKEVLTKDQYEKFTKISEARRSQARQRYEEQGGQGSDGEQRSRGRGRGGN